MITINSYVMYHCHTDYSLLDSCTTYQEYVNLAVANNSKALSISEHGKPLNWTEKWAACKKAGIKYIHSVEIYLTEDLENKVRDNYHTVLMARNIEGVRELNALVSKSCDKEHFYYTNRISFDEFLNISSNIISTSACLASPLNKLDESHPKYMELARKYDFFEIQAHNHPEQIDFNRRLLTLSKQLGKPLIAGTDTHSSTKYKAECRAVLLESKHKNYGDEDAFDLTYKTYDELVEMFEIQGALESCDYIQAINNTNLLYDMTEEIELDTTIKYPILYGSREADEAKFVETIEKKFKEKCDKGVIPVEQQAAFLSAIDEELRVFKKLEMTGFMLSMSELVSWCKEQGMAIGTARGSVGGSRIAYVTDIIDLNPEQWHTVFSRFCNEDRKEIGDIDLDCIEEDRPAIFKHIVDRFGLEKTARVASFGTIKDKGVIDDVGRALAIRWEKDNPKLGYADKNPWSIPNIKRIKKEFNANPEATKRKYPELFYYFDGLLGTKVSQSVHPAGMVISPITLNDNFGTFDKDDDICLMLDMDNVHDYTGLAKYDFLVLKTVQVIRDACEYANVKYPQTHEIDWLDEQVWADMICSPMGLFQFEGQYAYDCLRKFLPKNIFDMALVTACVRPSGASYRDKLLARKSHKNPSTMIDELLKDNLGYLIFQEDTIAFLQKICGLTGSEADNIRRAIGRKQKDRLDKAMPDILNGYCNKSPKPRYEAEQEAREFLQIIEDSADYQFGYNHAIAYCLLGYLCAYFRYYYPLEFITSFLNNAANDEDISNGTKYANKIGVRITAPKWGISKSEYYFNNEKRAIAKGLASIKYISANIAEELYNLATSRKYNSFIDVLRDIQTETSVNSRQLETLIKIDFFSEFGNQRELFAIYDIFNFFKQGAAKQIKKSLIDGTQYEETVKKYSTGKTKSGAEGANYVIQAIGSILYELAEKVYEQGVEDLDIKVKAQNFADIMGYAGYCTNDAKDRNTLYIRDVFPVYRRSDDKLFAYNILTQSLGSGKESSMTVYKKQYEQQPLHKGDFIRCLAWSKNGKYFRLERYELLH